MIYPLNMVIFHSYVNVYQRVFVLSLSSLLIFARPTEFHRFRWFFDDFLGDQLFHHGVPMGQWIIGGPGYHSKSGQQCSSQAAIAWYILDTTESLMLQAQKECSCIDHAHVLVSEDRSGCFSFRCSSPLIENFACCWRFLPANATDSLACSSPFDQTFPGCIVKGTRSSRISTLSERARLWTNCSSWDLVLPRGDRLATNVGSSTWDLLCCKSEAMPCSACKWLDMVGRQGSAGDLVPVSWGDCSRGQNVLTGIPVWLWPHAWDQQDPVLLFDLKWFAENLDTVLVKRADIFWWTYRWGPTVDLC